MVWLPTANADVEMLAVPLLKLPVPNVLAPSKKVTVPPGVPTAEPEADTVAVKVVDWPNTVGLTELVTVVAVAPLFTVWLNMAEVLELELLSPPYRTVIECVPTVREDVLKVAIPLALRAAVPRVVALSRK